VFSLRHECGHRAKWFTAKVRVESGDQNPNPAIRQFLDDGNDLFIEELRFIHRHYSGVFLEPFENDAGMLDRSRFELSPSVGGETHLAESCIDARFENLQFLASDFRPAQSADEFIGFSTEHRPDNEFNAAVLMFHTIPSLLLSIMKKAGVFHLPYVTSTSLENQVRPPKRSCLMPLPQPEAA
jgi:hypothetical protein